MINKATIRSPPININNVPPKLIKKNAIDKFDRKYGRITAWEHVRELN